MNLVRPVRSALSQVGDVVLSANVKLALFVWGAVSLLATLAYPFAYDQAAFFVGGEAILRDGAIPYRDFIDTKPPLIFYLYSLAAMLFGHNQWGIRLLEIVWQALTCLLLYRTLRSHLTSEGTAYLTTFFYAWQLSASGYWMTAQAETFAILPTLVIARCALIVDDHKAFKLGLLSGVALSAILLLKFTLVLFFVGVVIYMIRYRFRSETIPYVIGTSLTFVAICGAYLMHLNYVGGLDNFLEALRWVREYASITPLFGIETIGMEYHKLFPEFLLRSYSITLTLLGLVGLIQIFRSSEKRSPTLSLFVLCFVFALLGVLLERKFFSYHYTRAFLFFAPFVAIGAIAVWQYLQRRKVSFAMVLLGTLAIFFSPVMQTYTQTISWPMTLLTGKDREAIIQAKVPDYYARDQRLTGEYLRPLLSTQEQIFFWGNGVGTYFFADRTPQTMVLTVTPFITDWTSPRWKDSLLSQLQRSLPKYVVVEQGDARDYISGTTLDSYQHLQQWDAMRDLIATEYTEDRRIGHFTIYRRS